MVSIPTNLEWAISDYRLSVVTISLRDDEDFKDFGWDLREKQSIGHGVNTLSFQMIDQKIVECYRKQGRGNGSFH